MNPGRLDILQEVNLKGTGAGHHHGPEDEPMGKKTGVAEQRALSGTWGFSVGPVGTADWFQTKGPSCLNLASKSGYKQLSREEQEQVLQVGTAPHVISEAMEPPYRNVYLEQIAKVSRASVQSFDSDIEKNLQDSPVPSGLSVVISHFAEI
ncbi:hypothetical protein BTVI_06418 [Pitangus sulphuratus]|nr:hypothetical protein BTVI_06418 [Pitangus sulphuratus]